MQRARRIYSVLSDTTDRRGYIDRKRECNNRRWRSDTFWWHDRGKQWSLGNAMISRRWTMADGWPSQRWKKQAQGSTRVRVAAHVTWENVKKIPRCFSVTLLSLLSLLSFSSVSFRSFFSIRRRSTIEFLLHVLRYYDYRWRNGMPPPLQSVWGAEKWVTSNLHVPALPERLSFAKLLVF